MLIVGAGFSGATVARCLADAGRKITICDRRPHIGGNAYDYIDRHGVLVHCYGPHAFHTNSDKVIEFLSRFTEWTPYELRVKACVNDQLVPIPVNRTTLSYLYGKYLYSEDEAEYLLRGIRTNHEVRSSKEVILNAMGERLYSLIFEGYSRKQWGMDLSELAPQIAHRMPVRLTRDDRRSLDKFQAMPKHGYTNMFAHMLNHPNITVSLNCEIAARDKPDVWTGPLDAFFNYRLGKLPYRSLRFEHFHNPNTKFIQPEAVITFPSEKVVYTRTVEFKHMTGQKHSGTSWCREYPSAEGEPYYPVPRKENATLHAKYVHLAQEYPDVTFVGRLAQYRYYDMDQACAAALKAADKILGKTDG